MRVLVVEDYAPLRESLHQALDEAGFAVDAARDGDEGFWLARSAACDVLILDITLRRRDELSIVTALRSAGDRTPPAHFV